MDSVLVEQRGCVAIITLNRPAKLNALDAQMMVELADAWAALARDDRVRAVLLTAAGDKAFCAGADLGSLAPLITGARTPETVSERRWVDEHQSLVNRALLRNTDFRKPVVAAINGLAVAGGFELLLGTDIRVSSQGAWFQLSEVRRGLIPSGGSLSRLPRQIGWANAQEIILTAEPFSAQRALAVGLINRIVAPEDLLPVAMDLCERITRGAPLALAKAKETTLLCSGRDLDEAFRIEESAQAVVMASSDAREGPLAFMEKRKPRFTGR